MGNRIEKLALQGFRGATCSVEIEFEKNKSAAIIFGENGTGKSTIVDAIGFVCNKEYGSLTERSSTTPKSHLPSIGARAKELKVSITYAGQDWSATLGTGGPVIAGPTGRPTARILRRSQILQVVNAQPKTRYEALQSFIAVPMVQKCEDSLRDAIKTVNRELNDAVVAKNRAEETLEKLWKAEGSPGKSYFEWAREKAQEKAVDLQANVSAAKEILADLSSAIDARHQLATDELELSGCQSKLHQGEEKLKNAESTKTEQDASMISVLQNAKAFFEKHEAASHCPVCEQRIEAQKLRQSIIDRLSAMNEMVELKKSFEASKESVAKAENTVLRSRQKLLNAVCKLVPLVKNSALEEVYSIVADWQAYSHLLDGQCDAKASDIAEESQNLLKIIETCQTRLEARANNDLKTLNQLTAIKGHVDTIEEETSDTKRLESLSNRLMSLLAVVEKERKAYVEGVLNSVSQTIEDLYMRIHPHEEIGKIRLYLRPNFIGSLEFDAKFQTASEVPPQAYYSESHLDTLGVCVFLALAKHFNDGNTIVVLDDVVNSVDQAHMERFIQALHDEAGHFNQLIVATHYRPWRDKYLFARGPAANVQLIELLHWSLPRGIRHTKTKLSAEELSDYLKAEPMDRQIVASKAGILLESLLDHIALLYRCKLPRQAEPNYTLGDLTDCFGKNLKKAMKIEQLSDDAFMDSATGLESLLTDLGGMAWIRNQVGCHWNVAGMSVPDHEVTLLAERTIKLAESLVCGKCGELTRRNKSGTFWECRCSEKRLFPLTNPE